MELSSVQSGTYKLTSRRKELLYYFGFLLWPFGILLASFKNWRKPWAKNVFWLFCIFFGLTFIIGKDDGPDSFNYAMQFLRYAGSELKFKELLTSFYSESGSFVDIASPVISYLVSRISHNPQILFAVFGFIFGYFYSRNAWFILERLNGKLTFFILLFLSTLLLTNPIWNICNFRFWTAAQIFLYGSLPYLVNGNKKKLIWAFISVLFHFSFIFALGILIIFMVARNRVNLYLGFFLLTSFIKEINLQSVQSIFSFLPGAFQGHVSGYTNIDYAERVSNLWQMNNWYLVFSSKVIRWCIYMMVLFVYIRCMKHLRNRNDLLTLFCFSLLLIGASNIFSLVPSGNRFLVVSATFIFSFFILFIASFQEIRGLKIILAISTPLLMLFCIVSLRSGMDFYGLITVIGNPFFKAVSIDTYPLIEGLKKVTSL